jgi:hypothetical protein
LDQFFGHYNNLWVLLQIRMVSFSLARIASLVNLLGLGRHLSPPPLAVHASCLG